MIKTQQTNIAGFHCRIVEDDILNMQDKDRQIVLLCHGYGAPGDDLVGLANFYLQKFPKLQKNTVFIFPEAPLSLDAVGKAWWHIDMVALQRAMQSGIPRDRRGTVPPELKSLRHRFNVFLDEILLMYRLKYSDLILGGFSQGSMLTTDVALRLEEAVKGLIVFSGTLICEDEWKKAARKRVGLKVFQSHGRQDPILPFSEAEELTKLLKNAKVNVAFVEFQGEHAIPMPALTGAADLML